MAKKYNKALIQRLFRSLSTAATVLIKRKSRVIQISGQELAYTEMPKTTNSQEDIAMSQKMDLTITLVNKPRQIMQSVLYYRHGYDTSFEGFSGNQEDHQGAGHSPA